MAMNHKSLIESLLFVSPKPLSLKELVDFLKEDKAKIEEVLNQLVEEYNHSEKGIKIIENDKKYQMASSPENAKAVREFLLITREKENFFRPIIFWILVLKSTNSLYIFNLLSKSSISS